jgi:hypothetical protein
MKKLFILFIVLMGCTQKLKVDEAKDVVEGLIEEVKIGNYDAIDLNKYFSKEFMAESANVEKWKTHQKKAIDMLGPIQSYTLAGVSHKKTDLLSATELIYFYKHTELRSRNLYVMTKEDGKYKINRYNIRLEQ